MSNNINHVSKVINSTIHEALFHNKTNIIVRMRIITLAFPEKICECEKIHKFTN